MDAGSRMRLTEQPFSRASAADAHLAAHDLRRELGDRPVNLAESLVGLEVGGGELPDVRRTLRRPLYPDAAAGVLALAHQGQLASEFAKDHSTSPEGAGRCAAAAVVAGPFARAVAAALPAPAGNGCIAGTRFGAGRGKPEGCGFRGARRARVSPCSRGGTGVNRL